MRDVGALWRRLPEHVGDRNIAGPEGVGMRTGCREEPQKKQGRDRGHDPAVGLNGHGILARSLVAAYVPR